MLFRSLAKGVSEALITTAAGIIVAVPAVIFYNLLVNKVNLILIKMENQVSTLILMINAGKRVSFLRSSGEEKK